MKLQFAASYLICRNTVSLRVRVWLHPFLPRDTQSAVMPQYVFRPSVYLSVHEVQVPWSHRFEYFQNNFMAD